MQSLLEGIPASQQPEWPDLEQLQAVVAQLELLPPLVRPRTTDQLTSRLGEVAAGEAFFLQAGSCAETFTDDRSSVEDLFNVILPMTMVLADGVGVPIVKGGRLGGQYGKPRSAPTETIGGLTLPSFRGVIINGPEFTVEARRPDPWRMITAYNHARQTLGYVDELANDGFADLERIHDWNVKFADAGTGGERERYQAVAAHITKSIKFIKACGVDVASLPDLHHAEVFASHEALLLNYELALVRKDEKGKLYDSSAHMIWIGERTRHIDEAHVALCAKVENPIGAKLGPTATPEEVLQLCERLNPNKIPGRLTFITRMGADHIGDALPPLMGAVRNAGYPVVWACDPMHGNTITAPTGEKTRMFQSVVDEVEGFFGVADDEDTWGGGLHVELTGENVTECLGGSSPTTVTHLGGNYTTTCDPRLNPEQGIELAFKTADLVNQNKP